MLRGGMTETKDRHSGKEKKNFSALLVGKFYIIKEEGQKIGEHRKTNGQGSVEDRIRINIFAGKKTVQAARREDGKADYDTVEGKVIVQKGDKAQ